MFQYFEPENFLDSHRQSYKLIRNKYTAAVSYTYGQKRDRVGEDPHYRVIFHSLFQAPDSRMAPTYISFG